MASSRVDLKRVLILDLMCGATVEIIHGVRWSILRKRMVSRLGIRGGSYNVIFKFSL